MQTVNVYLAVDELRRGIERRERRNRIGFWLALTFVALNGADLLATRYILNTHQGAEGNPVMASLLTAGWFALVVKIGYPAFVGWRNRVTHLGVLAGLCVVMGMVVTWNLGHIV